MSQTHHVNYFCLDFLAVIKPLWFYPNHALISVSSSMPMVKLNCVNVCNVSSDPRKGGSCANILPISKARMLDLNGVFFSLILNYYRIINLVSLILEF